MGTRKDEGRSHEGKKKVKANHPGFIVRTAHAFMNQRISLGQRGKTWYHPGTRTRKKQITSGRSVQYIANAGILLKHGLGKGTKGQYFFLAISSPFHSRIDQLPSSTLPAQLILDLGVVDDDTVHTCQGVGHLSHSMTIFFDKERPFCALLLVLYVKVMVHVQVS